MAVPKKRTGKSAQAKRRANWKATTPATTTCKNCGSVVLAHTVCPECGMYKGKVASAKGQAMLESKAEEAKEVKKSKKAKEEVTEAKAEETKNEAETEAEKPKRTRKTKKAEAEETAKDGE